MFDIQKIGTYMFIIGVLISIFAGGFPITDDMKTIVLLIIIITGGFVGLLNIEEEREFHFLLAGGVFIIATMALRQYLVGLELLGDIEVILNNLLIFTAMACIVVGLKLIFLYASVRQRDEELEAPEFDDPKRQAVWDFIIFLSVCLAFVIFILEAFFYTNSLTTIIDAVSWTIVVIFLIDVIILFGKAKTMKGFFANHWPDIISVIPFSGVFQLAKLFRFVRIAQGLSRTSKLARVSKISHSAKFFSKHSGFNKYLKEKKD